MDQALGTAVFAGMIGVTFFGIFFTLVFFSVIMKFLAECQSSEAQTTICDLLLLSSLFGGKPKTLLKLRVRWL